MKKIALILALLIVTSLVLVACGEEEVFDFATIDGQNYNSEFFGITANIPSEFEIFTPEKIEETTGAKRDITALDVKDGMVYDLYAVAPTGANFNCVASKPGRVNIDKEIEKLKTEMVDELAKNNITTDSIEIVNVKIGNKEFKGLSYVYSYSGVKLYATQFYVVKGKYYGCYTFTANNEKDIDTMISYFSAK